MPEGQISGKKIEPKRPLLDILLLPTGLYLNSSVHAVTRDQLVNSLGFTAFAASNLRCNPARRIRSSSLCVLNDRDISPVSG